MDINLYKLDLEIKGIVFKYLQELEDRFRLDLLEVIGDSFEDYSIYSEKFLEKRKEFNFEKKEQLFKKYSSYTGVDKIVSGKIFFKNLTFGELVRIFRDLNSSNKKKIVYRYNIKKSSIFESWIFGMRFFRNLVCHGEIISNRKFKETLKGKDISKLLDIKINNTFFSYLLVLEIFSILNGNNNSIYIEILEKIKNLPVGEHISQYEIEAWKVLIRQVYSIFIRSQIKIEENIEKKVISNKKTILITGGTGYIGSHGVVAFEQAGYKTVLVDNLSNSSLETLDNIEKILGYKPDFFEVDLRDKDKLEEVFRKYDFDGVIHFAGLKAVGESCEKPDLYFDNNINGSNNLFGLMTKYGVKNIVFSSSATVYTSPQPSTLKGHQGPLEEKGQVGECSNPYGTTKFLIENILKDLAKFSGFRVMNLRYFNPIGAHPSGFLGEDPEGIPNNLMPFVFKVAKGELEELTVFGDDYDTIDGTGVRDYIDVVDLIDGHLKAYESLTSSQPSTLKGHQGPLEEKEQGEFYNFNLGVGRGISVLEMIKATEKVVGKKINYKIVDRRAGDLAEVYCNPKKAKKELDWEAKISLKKSLENSWKFYDK